MATAPIIEFRQNIAPYGVIAALVYAQSALGGNDLPVLGGEDSKIIYFRVYNNYGRSTGIANANNLRVTVFDGADPASHTYAQSPASQSWVRIFETGFGENSTPPGVFTQFLGQDTAIGRSLIDAYIPEFGSDGQPAQTNTVYPRLRAGTDQNGVGFIEFATYIEAPDSLGFATYAFAVSIVYDWTS